MVVKATGNNPVFKLKIKSDFANAIAPLVIMSLLIACCFPLCCLGCIACLIFLFIFCIVMAYLALMNIRQIKAATSTNDDFEYGESREKGA